MCLICSYFWLTELFPQLLTLPLHTSLNQLTPFSVSLSASQSQLSSVSALLYILSDSLFLSVDLFYFQIATYVWESRSAYRKETVFATEEGRNLLTHQQV